MTWYQWVHFGVTGVAVALWAAIGTATLADALAQYKANIRRRQRDEELEAQGVNLRLTENNRLRAENRELRERVRSYEKGKNIFGQISP